MKDKFLKWLEPHLKQMLSFDGFKASNLYQVDEIDPSMCQLVVHYQVESLEKLLAYFAGPAQSMREEGVKYFGGAINIQRRTLLPIQ